MDLATNLQMMTAGLAMGAIYALVALGFVLIFQRRQCRELRPRGSSSWSRPSWPWF